ncbi:MAG: acetoacetate decarboxylase family protein [Rubrobacter sp.]|nr:acetoacetate decarboxylase family protein [Rubrobacter sp.]
MTLRGYSVPRTQTGRASLVPPPPWHYVGDFLVVDYWAEPDAAKSVLPDGLLPHPDAGRCAVVCADWQSCSEGGDEIVDPSRSHYKEFFIVVNALLDGEEVTTCPFIWVDQDFALARGWIQGFPKKLGEIWMTRTFGVESPADPGLAPGGRHGATCSARGRAMADLTVEIESGNDDEGPRHNAPPIVNVRHFPRLAAGRHDDPQVHELVRAVSRDRVMSKVASGSATLNLYPAPGEEHDILAPVKIGRGYRFTFGYTVDDLETVKEIR